MQYIKLIRYLTVHNLGGFVTVVCMIKTKFIRESDYSCLLQGWLYVNGYILCSLPFGFFIYGEVHYINHLFSTRVKLLFLFIRFSPYFTTCLIAVMCREAKQIKVYIHLIIFLLIHSKFCALDFISPTQTTNVCRSCPHIQKGWTGLLWYRRRPTVTFLWNR